MRLAAAAVYSPLGRYLTRAGMWQGIKAQTRASMQPHHLDPKDPRNVWEIVRRRRWNFSRRCTAADALNAMIDAHKHARPRFALQLVEDAA